MKLIFIITIIGLILIWGTFLWYLYSYGEEVRRDPCSVCAKRIGEDVTCTTSGISRVYYDNGSIEDIIHRTESIVKINYSLMNISK